MDFAKPKYPNIQCLITLQITAVIMVNAGTK